MERLWRDGEGTLAEAGVVGPLALVLRLHDGVHQVQIVISILTAGEVLLLLRLVEETSGTNGHQLKVGLLVCTNHVPCNLLDNVLVCGYPSFCIETTSYGCLLWHKSLCLIHTQMTGSMSPHKTVLNHCLMRL